MAVTIQRLENIDNSIHSLLNNEKIKDAPASDPTKKALEAVDKMVESLIASMKQQSSQGGGAVKQHSPSAANPPATPPQSRK
jgi:hypothetical protein